MSLDRRLKIQHIASCWAPSSGTKRSRINIYIQYIVFGRKASELIFWSSNPDYTVIYTINLNFTVLYSLTPSQWLYYNQHSFFFIVYVQYHRTCWVLLHPFQYSTFIVCQEPLFKFHHRGWAKIESGVFCGAKICIIGITDIFWCLSAPWNLHLSFGSLKRSITFLIFTRRIFLNVRSIISR